MNSGEHVPVGLKIRLVSQRAMARNDFCIVIDTSQHFIHTGNDAFKGSAAACIDEWINAIKKDSITWTNVSDLKGFKNEAFLRYDVKFIPQNYLVNPEGKIIKYRLCSESYADYELEQIFDNQEN